MQDVSVYVRDVRSKYLDNMVHEVKGFSTLSVDDIMPIQIEKIHISSSVLLVFDIED